MKVKFKKKARGRIDESKDGASTFLCVSVVWGSKPSLGTFLRCLGAKCSSSKALFKIPFPQSLLFFNVLFTCQEVGLYFDERRK